MAKSLIDLRTVKLQWPNAIGDMAELIGVEMKSIEESTDFFLNEEDGMLCFELKPEIVKEQTESLLEKLSLVQRNGQFAEASKILVELKEIGYDIMQELEIDLSKLFPPNFDDEDLEEDDYDQDDC